MYITTKNSVSQNIFTLFQEEKNLHLYLKYHVNKSCINKSISIYKIQHIYIKKGKITTSINNKLHVASSCPPLIKNFSGMYNVQSV